MKDRLETLESKIAHLELAFDELNNEVYLQAQQLDQAQIEIQQWQARLSEKAQDSLSVAPSAEDELPPHY